MPFIRVAKGELVPVSDEEGAAIDEYFRLLNANVPSRMHGRDRPCFSIVVGGSSDVGEKAILDSLSTAKVLSHCHSLFICSRSIAFLQRLPSP